MPGHLSRWVTTCAGVWVVWNQLKVLCLCTILLFANRNLMFYAFKIRFNCPEILFMATAWSQHTWILPVPPAALGMFTRTKTGWLLAGRIPITRRTVADWFSPIGVKALFLRIEWEMPSKLRFVLKDVSTRWNGPCIRCILWSKSCTVVGVVHGFNSSHRDGLISIGTPPPEPHLISNRPVRSPSLSETDVNSMTTVVLQTWFFFNSTISGGHRVFLAANGPLPPDRGKILIRRMEEWSDFLKERHESEGV
jgi:hypothetical protein